MAQEGVLQAYVPFPAALNMPRTLFLLTPSMMKGGNYSTIERIRSHLVNNGHTCILSDVAELEKTDDTNEFLENLQVDLIIGIHAFRTGRIMKDCKVPYILILGGTDVNEFSKDEEQMAVMTVAVARARRVISFSKSLQKKALALWPNLSASRMTIIAQAVITRPSEFSLYEHLRSHYGVNDSEAKIIFLLAGSVRPVKNPVYLMDTLSDLHRDDERILFVLVGHVADEEYNKQEFQPALQRCEGVVYIPGLSSEDMHRAIQQSFALVNSSNSEGMSLAILEAMQLKVPVLARDIPGNSAVIEDGENGMLFATPQEFRKKALRIMGDAAYRSQIVAAAAEYTAAHHSVMQEKAAYYNIVESCLAVTDDAAKPQDLVANGYSE